MDRIRAGNGTVIGRMADGNRLAVSTDSGATWQVVRPLIGGSLREIEYGASGWIAVGEDSDSKHYLLHSSNGINWTKGPEVNDIGNWGLVYANGTYYAISYNFSGAQRTYSSTNGTTWSDLGETDLTVDPERVVYDTNNNLLILVGGGGKIATSSNGINWTVRVEDTSGNTFRDAHFSNGATIVIGSTKTLYRSTDGTTWNTVQSTETGYYGITHMPGDMDDGLWLALDYQNDFSASTNNGVTWNLSPGIGFSSPSIRSLTYNPGDELFYASGQVGMVINNDDASDNWTILQKNRTGSI